MMSQNDPGSITKVSRLNTLILHFKAEILQLKGNSHAQMPLPCIFVVKKADADISDRTGPEAAAECKKGIMMELRKIKNKGQARLFESRYLEMLTKTHPLIIWGMYLPLIIYMIYYSYAVLWFAAETIACLFAGALLFWTFFEYLMHRFVFHMVSENPRLKKLAYMIHGNHHEYPRDRQRLFMPPVPSILLAASIFGIMYLFMQHIAYMFFPGFLFGYLIYGSIHYAIHAWNPPFPFMKPLWRNHHLHHYKSEEKGFGVSTSLWDRMFGTFFD